MNAIYNFLTQTYVAAIPTYMVIAGTAAVVLAVFTLTKGGLIRHFLNYGK